MRRCRPAGILALFLLLAVDTGSAAAQEPAPDPELELMRERLVAALVPEDPSAREALADSARAYLERQRPDGSWPDVDYADDARARWQPRTHLVRLRELARAYRTPGQALHRSEQVAAAVRSGLDLWFARDPRSDNWWHNEIGAPLYMGETMLLADSLLSRDQHASGVDVLRRSALVRERASGRRVEWTGANLVWMAGNMILRALVEPSPEALSIALPALFSEIRQAEVGEEGIQADYSFHQHGAVLYNGGYGSAFVSDAVRFIRLADGTRWAIDPERRDLLERYVLDGSDWMIRGGFWDYGVIGRNLVREDVDASGFGRAVMDLAELPGDRQQALRAAAARALGRPGAPPLVGNRHFWRSDYMAHHRPEYLISARMASTRTRTTDGFINDEGRLSHHLADGAMMIYRRGDEYRNIFPVWAWERIPGTTVELDVPHSVEEIGERGSTAWVGGVSDGRYGMAAMDLERDALAAAKAWFFFDDVVVALGAGIAVESDRPVITTVNQALLRGEVEDGIEYGMRVIWHDSVAYLFPVGTPVEVRAQPQTGSWAKVGAGPASSVTHDVFSLWIEHGSGVDSASYRYFVVPGSPNPRAAVERVQVLSNTPALQAVEHAELGIVQVAFREAGSLEFPDGLVISVDRPCLVMLRESDGRLALSVSNPENEAAVVRVGVRWSEQSAGVTRAKAASVRVQLPGGALAGSTVTRELGTER